MQNAICKLVHNVPQRKWFIKVDTKPLEAGFLLTLSGTPRVVEFEHFSCLTEGKINNLSHRKIALDSVKQAKKTSFKTTTIQVKTLQKGTDIDIELNSTETRPENSQALR